MRIILIVNVI